MSASDTKAYAEWKGDDVTVLFSGEAERSHFGTDIVDIDIEEVDILGVKLAPQELPQALLVRLHELTRELSW